MKIKFLGTSAGWPLPRLGCKCEICSSPDPKDTRTRTQLLVNNSILLDAGPDTYRHLLQHNCLSRESENQILDPASTRRRRGEQVENDKNVDPTKIEAVLVSHQHPDHILGFWDLTHIYNGQTIIIYATKHLVSRINNLLGPHKKNLKVELVYENKPFLIGNVKVEYFPVIHGKTPAWGIKLKENKIFVYIADFRKILPSQEKVVRHSDYWAIDGSTLGKAGQSPGHISIQDGIVLTNKYKIKNTYFVHIGHKTQTHQSLENYLRKDAGSNFHIAHDGLEINI